MNKNRRFRNKMRLAALGIMLSIALIAFNIGTTLILGHKKIDATADKYYSLSSKTTEWLKKNKQKLYVKLYISEQLDSSYPLQAQYMNRVLSVLDKYKQNSQTPLQIEVSQISPFSSQEEEAKKQGIRSFSDEREQRNFYSGAVFRNNNGESLVIPFFEPRRHLYLEHDISRILSKLSGYTPKRIAVMSPVLPIINKRKAFENTTEWNFITQLRQDYQVDYLSSNIVQIPSNYDLVILVNPQNMSKIGQYAIDQYLLYGGNLIIVMDPFSETLLSLTANAGRNNTQMVDFLASKGIGYDENSIVGDVSLGEETKTSTVDNTKVHNYPLWMEIKAPYINPQSPLTDGLQKIRVKSTGNFVINNMDGRQTTTLYATSENGGQIDAVMAKFLTKKDIKESFESQNQKYRLGILIEGTFKSLFSEHPLGNTEYLYKLLPFISVSVNPGKLLLLGDSDMLADHNWNAVQNTANQGVYDYIPYNNNMDLLERLIDYLTNSPLLSIAPKLSTKEMLTPNQAIQAKVWAKYQSAYEKQRLSLQHLQNELAALKNKIHKNLRLPSDSLARKISLLHRDIDTATKKLNELDYQINAEKQNIERNLMLSNIVIFPVCGITAIMLTVYFYRRRKKREAMEYVND